MSVYKALIDFRDNENDPMWVKNEDPDGILKIATVSNRNRGKSIVEFFFTEEEFISIFSEQDNDYSNNNFYISIAFHGRRYGNVFLDESYEGDYAWEEGYMFSYFDEENKNLIKEIFKLSRPSLSNVDFNSYDDARDAGSYFQSFFNNQASEIAYDYTSEYDNALIEGLREYIKNKICNPFKNFNIIEKTCREKYYTTVNNLLKVWNDSGVSEDSTVLEMLKQLVVKYDLGIDEDLGEDYHNYFEDRNFDSVGFNRNVNRILERLKDNLEEDFDNEEVKMNGKIFDKLASYGYRFDKRYSFPTQKTFGKKSNNQFIFRDISQGKVKVELVNDYGKNPVNWMDYEELMNFLFHPELF
jgi:hypothetical protein